MFQHYQLFMLVSADFSKIIYIGFILLLVTSEGNHLERTSSYILASGFRKYYILSSNHFLLANIFPLQHDKVIMEIWSRESFGRFTITLNRWTVCQ